MADSDLRPSSKPPTSVAPTRASSVDSREQAWYVGASAG